MSEYFPKPFKTFGGNTNAKVDLSNYATKSDIKDLFTCLRFKFCVKNKLSKFKN